METLSIFSVFKGAHIHDIDRDDEAPFYEESHVNEVVVPFSWEEKPGVPSLRMISNRRHGGGNLRPKDVCIANAEKRGAIFVPLPKPPAASLQNSSLPPSTCANKKQKKPYVNKSTTLMCRVDPHMIEGDPFKKAIEACRHSKMSSEYSMTRMHNGNRKPLIEKVGTSNEHREISPAYLNKSSTPLRCRGAGPHVIEGAIEACRHSASGYIRMQNGNCKPAIEKDAAYNAGRKGGQPAFTDADAQKLKPNGFALLGRCRSVHNYDSIVRIN